MIRPVLNDRNEFRAGQRRRSQWYLGNLDVPVKDLEALACAIFTDPKSVEKLRLKPVIGIDKVNGGYTYQEVTPPDLPEKVRECTLVKPLETKAKESGVDTSWEDLSNDWDQRIAQFMPEV